MWDISKPETFDNIPNLINEIELIIKKNNIEIPIFIIENKKDLKLDDIKSAKSVTEIELNKKIGEFKKKENIIYKNISLLYKDEFYELIFEILVKKYLFFYLNFLSKVYSSVLLFY